VRRSSVATTMVAAAISAPSTQPIVDPQRAQTSD
jgi:hypothetical protein